MKYRNGSHTKYNIEYHFVWATKYLYQVLVRDVGFRVRELVRQTCEQLEVEILKGVVSKDHVHLLVSAAPTVSASNIMKRVKGRSSTKLFQEYP
ncbi:MAG: putative transposase [Alteromonadaceae bacterium]|jgi:putative transposase